MIDLNSIIRKVQSKMQSCGQYGEQAEIKRMTARANLQDQGIGSFVVERLNAAPLVYFTLSEPVNGTVNDAKVRANGFALNPAKDWAVEGLLAV